MTGVQTCALPICFNEFGTYATIGSVAEAAKYVKAENELFGGVIKSLGLKAE